MNLARRFAARSLAARLADLASRRAVQLATLPAAVGPNAQGFAIHDLTPIGNAAAAAFGPGYIFRAEPEPVSLHCPECNGGSMIAIPLRTQTDGTEERVRSGVNTMAHK